MDLYIANTKVKELEDKIAGQKQIIANLEKEKQSKTKIQTSPNNNSKSQLKDDSSREKEIQKELSSLNEQISNANATLGALASLDEEANKTIMNIEKSDNQTKNLQTQNITLDLSSIKKELCYSIDGNNIYEKLDRIPENTTKEEIKSFINTYKVEKMEIDTEIIIEKFTYKKTLCIVGVPENKVEDYRNIVKNTVTDNYLHQIIDRQINIEINKINGSANDYSDDIAYRVTDNVEEQLCKTIFSKANLSVAKGQYILILTKSVDSHLYNVVLNYMHVRRYIALSKLL